MQASIYILGAPWPDIEINANAELKMLFFVFLSLYIGGTKRKLTRFCL